MTKKPETYGLEQDTWDMLPDEVKKMHIEHHEKNKDKYKSFIMAEYSITEHDWNSMRPAIKKLVQHLYKEIGEWHESMDRFHDWYEKVPI